MSVSRQIFNVYFTSVVVLVLITTILRGWFDFEHIEIWFGALVGMLLPDFDHFVHVYFLKPHELTSQRVRRYWKNKDFKFTFELMYNTRSERTTLVFHSAFFQWVFVIFGFYVLTSSNNFFGRGLVMAFLLHLVLDQYLDLKKSGNIQNWFHNFQVILNEKQAKLYVYFMFAVLLFLSFVV